MQATYIGNNRVLVTLAYGSRIFVAADDLSISPHLIGDGFIEAPLTNFLGNNVQPGQVAVDVGANMGYFTVLLGNRVGPSGVVYAYEPHPLMFHLLDDNLRINYLTEHVHRFRMAIHSKPGTIRLHVSRRYVGSSSIHGFDGEPDALARELGHAFETIEVPTARLDDLLKDVPRIDWLKIDIEGGEYEAFRGMQGLFERRAVGTLIFELNRVMLKDDNAAFDACLLQLVNGYGAEIYGLDAEGRLVPATVDAFRDVQFYPFGVLRFP